MRIATIVGARPQFIKAVLLSRELRKSHAEILIHTGQHYGESMSQIFFDELGLPKPDYNLGVNGGHPAWQVGMMIAKLAELLALINPDLVIVYGDTHSTLAGAVAAAKMEIPLAHVEAGLRSFRPEMHEEKNRIVTDHLSSLLFCPTKTAAQNLKAERITKGCHLVGDIMVDTLNHFLPIAERKSSILTALSLSPKNYFLATIHRAENADDPKRLQSIFDGLAKLGREVILPLHPRTEKELKKNGIQVKRNVRIIDPVGYFDMLVLQKNAGMILTDSGGMQKEAYLLNVPCVTLRDETEWIETVKSGWNRLAGDNPHRICRAINSFNRKKIKKPSKNLFGDGKTARRILEIVNRFSPAARGK